MKPLMPFDGTWRDATSYARGERIAETEPRTWKLEMGDLFVVVTKHTHYGDEWTIMSDSLDIRHSGLDTTDIDEAKRKAVRIALRACTPERKKAPVVEVVEPLTPLQEQILKEWHDGETDDWEDGEDREYAIFDSIRWRRTPTWAKTARNRIPLLGTFEN